MEAYKVDQGRACTGSKALDNDVKDPSSDGNFTGEDEGKADSWIDVPTCIEMQGPLLAGQT